MTLITATATKTTVDAKLGIAFSRQGEEAPLVVKLVREEGLFAKTGLEAGMVVDQVQGVEMTWMTPKDAADALRKGDGEVTITAFCFVGEVTKAKKDSKLGISLKNSTKKEGIFVSKIAEDSIFADSDLKVGQKVLSVNGTVCPPDTKAAIRLLKDAKGSLKIVCADHELEQPEMEAAAPQDDESPKAVADVERVESATASDEKKDESDPAAAAATDGDGDGDGEGETRELKETKTEEALESESAEKKGLLDTMFASCIC